MTGYTDIIRKYATDDSHAGRLHQADGVGEVGLSSAEAGRKLAVRFTLQVLNDRIERARYQVFGCGFTIAACAATAELIEGQPLNGLSAFNAATINRHLGGLPDERGYCAELAVQALQAAVDSVQSQAETVVATFSQDDEGHPPRAREDHPVYRSLVRNPTTKGKPDDRHLLACLLVVADQESSHLHRPLGLSEQQLDQLLSLFFPQLDRSTVFGRSSQNETVLPETDPHLLALLRSYLSPGLSPDQRILSDALVRIVAARAAHPGHLWVAMGLFERSQLSAAIQRHLPRLFNANRKGMRWKRFLFKQLCEQSGGGICRSPVCGDCSDYTLCFVDE